MLLKFIVLIITITTSINSLSCPNKIDELFRKNQDHYVMGYYKDNVITSSMVDLRNEYSLINLEKGNNLWNNNDFMKIVKHKYILNHYYSYKNKIFVDINDDLYCFDALPGNTLWRNKKLANTSTVIKVLNDRGFTIKKDGLKYNLLTFDLSTGLIISNQSIYTCSNCTYFRFYDISNDYLLINTNGKIICISRDDNRIKWQYEIYSNYYEDARIYNHYMIATATDNNNKCRYSSSKIYCIDLISGKEVWSIYAQDNYILKDNYLYYFLGDTRCTDNQSKTLGIVDIYSGEIKKRIYIDNISVQSFLLTYDSKILLVGNYTNENLIGTIVYIYDDLLGPIDSIVLDNYDNYKIFNTSVFDDYLIIHAHNDNIDKSIFSCLSLIQVKNNPTSIKIIYYIIKYILNRLRIP